MKKIIKLSFLVSLIAFNLANAQKCEPAETIKQPNGDVVNLYGGKLRKGGFMSNDRSRYALYVAQLNDGKKGSSIVAYVSERVKNKREYDHAVNNFLNENSLKNSSLKVILNNELLEIPMMECKQTPSKLLGDIVGYTITYEGDIKKEYVKKLQSYDIQKFRLVVGGKPFERIFKKPTKNTKKIKESFNCVEIDNVFEVKKKKASEMDLSEVSKSDYASTINGHWNLQKSNGVTVEFKDGKVIYSKKGVKESEGSYKIVANRVIITTDKGNSIAEISMFLKDMLILKESGEEKTYERL